MTIDRPTSPDGIGLLLLLLWLVVAVTVLEVVAAEDEEDVDEDAEVEAFRLVALFDLVDVVATLSVSSGGNGRLFFPLGGWLEMMSEEDEEEEDSANTSMFHTGTAIYKCAMVVGR
jgi:hypothetical protein